MKPRTYLTLGAVVVLAAFGVFVGIAGAAGTLDQSQTSANDLQPVPGAPSFPSYRIAQTFTAGITGSLDQVDLFLVRQFSPGDLVVEIRSVSAGLPTGTVLAAAAVSEATVPTGVSVWVSVPFNVPAVSTAGSQYAIVVHAPDGDCGGDCWLWWGGLGDPYAGGQALFAPDGVSWGSRLDLDFTFRTYVNPLPTSKEQCKDDGWRDFPQFKNQGDCVSFVENN